MTTLDCARAEELVSARLDRGLTAEEAQALAAHLAGCAGCRRAAAEHANLAAELEAAFRAEPLGEKGVRTLLCRAPEGPFRQKGPDPFFSRPAAVRGHPRRLWLRLAAAAALLVAGAGVAAHLDARPAPPDDDAVVVSQPAALAGGTTVTPVGPARLELLGRQGRADLVIRLVAGEIEVRAAKAGPGRTAVRVETPLGRVETLGTVFRVKLVGLDRGGEGNMRLSGVVSLAGALLLVSVDEGRVLLRAELGPVVVQAGEGAEVGPGKITVGAADRVIRAMVTKVEDGKDGALAVTIPAGKADGIREGFEFTCKFKDWTGKVVSVGADSAVLEVSAELKAKVALRDLAETKLTTVLAEAKPGEKPEVAPVKVEAVEGLELVLVKRETVFKYTMYVDKEGKPIRIGRDGKGPVPEGAEEKVQERKSQELVAQLRNVSDKPVVLGFALGSGGWGMGANPIKLFARDAEGKEVPRMDGYVPAVDKSGPAAVTIIKPGQVLEQQYQWLPFRFPAEGKYIVWATLEEQPRPEVLPGVKPWSGKLKSNEVEWEYKGMKGVGGWGPGGGGDRVIIPLNPGGAPGQPMPPATPVPNPDKKEVF